DHPRILELLRKRAVRVPFGEGLRDLDRLAWSDCALDMICAHLWGYPPTTLRNRSTIEVYMPDVFLLERARSGMLVWLAVAPMPEPILETIGADAVTIDGQPEMLHVVAVGDRNWGKGRKGASRQQTEA